MQTGKAVYPAGDATGMLLSTATATATATATDAGPRSGLRPSLQPRSFTRPMDPKPLYF